MMNELWAVVMWDDEQDRWYHRIRIDIEGAQKAMLDWVRENLEAMELDYVMRKNDEQEIELVNEHAKALGVVRKDTATLDVGYRERIEWYMFRVM